MAGWATGGYVQRAVPRAGGYQDLSNSMYNNGVGVNNAGGLSTVPSHIQPQTVAPGTIVRPPTTLSPGNPATPPPAPPTTTTSTTTTPGTWDGKYVFSKYGTVRSDDPRLAADAAAAGGTATPPPAPAPGAGAGTADQFVGANQDLLNPSNPWSRVYQGLSGSGIDAWNQTPTPTGQGAITSWMQGGATDPLMGLVNRVAAFGGNSPYEALLEQVMGGKENAAAAINHFRAGGGEGYLPSSPQAFGWHWDGTTWQPPSGGDTSGLAWDAAHQRFVQGANWNPNYQSYTNPAYGAPAALNTTGGGSNGPTTVTSPSPTQSWLGNWWDHPDMTPTIYADPTAPTAPAGTVKVDPKTGKPLATAN